MNPIDSFRNDVLEGNRVMLAEDYMTFLYHDDEFREEDIEYGLFRGPLLVAVCSEFLSA